VIYQGKIIEEKEKEEIFMHPSHPYTQKLIEAFKGLEE
jgi:ABC-type dipeptide/oligopeptide/nickel transport system ATPase component